MADRWLREGVRSFAKSAAAESILSPVQGPWSMARWGPVSTFRAPAAALLLLAGCLPAAEPGDDERRILALQDPSPRVREEAFQSLLREGGAPASKLRMAV